MSKQWTCPFCFSRNVFPPHYAEHITETHLPAELIAQLTTVEYQLPGKAAPPPAFVFLIDACLAEDEMAELKDSLSQALSLLPPAALVGLVSFGTMVTVHELSPTSSAVPRAYVLKGDKDYDPGQVASLLGLGGGGGGGGGAPPSNRFIAPVAEASLQLERILDDMTRDPWPCAADQRPARATGVGLRVATTLLERGVGKQGGRVVLCTGGPCTVGPGAVAGRQLVETMRSHTDIVKGSAPLLKGASAWYKELAARMSAAGHTLDVFACALDQVGLLEMRPCVAHTGGLAVLADSFKQSVFKESFRRLFRKYDDGHPDAGNLLMGFGATLEVNTSRDFRVSGALGPCVGLGKTGPSVSDTEVGQGGTYAWSLGAIDPTSTISLFFDVAGKDSGGTASAARRHHLQIVTYYQHSSGRYRMRVTTTAGTWCGEAPRGGGGGGGSGEPADGLTGSALASLAASFDQEAAAVLLARVAVSRTETEDTNDILNWLDRSLIRLCARFAEYRKDDAESFRLAPNFSLFPQFMFHLRRSQFMQTFNSSPDEAAYYRLAFLREDVSTSLLMIQPSLMCYSFSAPAQPVLLDATSVRPDVILLLDTFFYVLVFHGETIALWRDQGYADLPEHAAFRALLQAPKDDAAALMDSRFPVPRYIICDQHKSQARFLMARVNPSVTHNNIQDNAAAGAMPVLTDDVSLGVFMHHLAKFASAS